MDDIEIEEMGYFTEEYITQKMIEITRRRQEETKERMRDRMLKMVAISRVCGVSVGNALLTEIDNGIYCFNERMESLESEYRIRRDYDRRRRISRIEHMDIVINISGIYLPGESRIRDEEIRKYFEKKEKETRGTYIFEMEEMSEESRNKYEKMVEKYEKEIRERGEMIERMTVGQIVEYMMKI